MIRSDFDKKTVAEMIYKQQNNEFFQILSKSKQLQILHMTDNKPEILCSETNKMLQLKGQ